MMQPSSATDPEATVQPSVSASSRTSPGRALLRHGPFVVEQQAYYTDRSGQITWMRVLCSGFRPR
jgi:hypothetical protein